MTAGEIVTAQLKIAADWLGLIALPGQSKRVELGDTVTREYLERLRTVSGAQYRCVIWGEQAHRGPYIRETVQVTVAGVRFEAALEREPNDFELRRLHVIKPVAGTQIRYVVISTWVSP